MSNTVGVILSAMLSLPAAARAAQSSQVEDFQVDPTETETTLDLSWTAPTNGDGGPVPWYQLTYTTTAPADPSDPWDPVWSDPSAVQPGGEPSPPGTPGTTEQMHLAGLDPDTTYWFKIDSSVHLGGPMGPDMLINAVTSGSTLALDVTDPDTIATLNAAVQGSSITLEWPAAADDAGQQGSGGVSTNTVAYAPVAAIALIDDGNWDHAAVSHANAGSSGDPGSAAHFTVGNLQPGVTYTFSVRATDSSGNSGAASTNATATALFDPESGKEQTCPASAAAMMGLPILLIGLAASGLVRRHHA